MKISANDVVRTLIRTGPISVNEKMTLRSVAAVLASDDIGAALVHRNDQPAGILSERDIVRALADDADVDSVWSADVMTEDLVSVDSGESILRVAFRMTDEGIRHMAVVENHQIVGVISARDVFEVLSEDALQSM